VHHFDYEFDPATPVTATTFKIKASRNATAGGNSDDYITIDQDGKKSGNGRFGSIQ